MDEETKANKKADIKRDYMKEAYDFLTNTMKLNNVTVKNYEGDKDNLIKSMLLKLRLNPSGYRLFIEDVNPAYIEVSGELEINLPMDKRNDVDNFLKEQNYKVINGKFLTLRSDNNKTFCVAFRNCIVKAAFSCEYLDTCISSVNFSLKNVLNDVLKFAIEEKENKED